MAGLVVSFDNPQALVDGTAGLASGSSLTSVKQKNQFHRGLKVWINISAISGGCTLTVTIRAYDPVTGNTLTILASAALSGTGESVLTIFPGLTASANVTANDVLPPVWDVIATAAVGGSVTFTVAESKLA